MMIRRWTFFVALLLSAPATASAEPTPPPMNPVLRATANGVRDDMHARALSLRRFDVSVDIHGSVAETTVEASFANASSEQLEGDFRLALPQGAVINGYALDIAGQMTDGVLVDRPRAKAVYEARVRRGVDPGLAEATPDGAFETRIFPIWPGRGRTIRVRFVTPIPADGYRFPIAIDAPIDGWSLTVTAAGVNASPALTGPDGNKVSFDQSSDGYHARLEGKTPLAGDLWISRAEPLDLVVSEHPGGERDLELGGPLPSPAAGQPRAQFLRIYWDRSRSRLDNNIDGEIALVRRAIETIHPAKIELVSFNSSGADRQFVASADAAEAWLKSVRYRGATSFASLAKDGAADHCILFSDGGPVIDRNVDFAPPCRLDAVSSGPNADIAWLRHLANSRGGQAFVLRADNSDEVSAQLASNSPHVYAVLDRDGKSLPFVPLDAAPGYWRLLARAPEGGSVTVRLAGGGATSDVVRSSDGVATPFDGAGALLAADALATLSGDAQRADYVALSRRYGIASPSLSFVVLELPSDYLAAGIDPPANYPVEARDDFLRQRKAIDAETATKRNDWLEHIVQQWGEQVIWWKTKFDPNAQPKRIATSQHFDRPTTNGLPPAPPPPPVVAPMASRPSASGRAPAALESVTVTSNRIHSDVQNVPIAITALSQEQLTATDDSSDGNRGNALSPSSPIQIDAWQPDRPYLELYDGKPAEFDERFLEAEKKHGSLPIFYMDTAEWLRKHGRTADAIEMVLSALELPSANEVTLGIVADRLERYGAIDRAIELRERQMVLDPERPQPKRLLALALARRAAHEPSAHARTDLERAVQLLYDIAVTPQDSEWDGIELIALDEANALVPRLHRLGGSIKMDPRLVALLDVDERVVIDWTTDATDMDLWVDEPNGERAIYNNPHTVIGGRLSHDMTRGYGPEEYMLHHAPPGTYLVQSNVYAPDRLDPNGATILTAHLFRDFGRPAQREDSIDVELTRDDKGSKIIGRLLIPGGTKEMKNSKQDTGGGH